MVMRRIRWIVLGLALLALPLTAALAAGDGLTAEPVWPGLDLGSDGPSIHSGGVMVQDGEDLYFSDSDGIYQYAEEGGLMLADEAGENLNVVDGALWYTVDGDIRALALNGGEPWTAAQWSGDIDQMFMASGGTAYLLSDGAVYALYIDTEEWEHLAGDGEVTSFIPTEFGLVYAVGDRYAETVYVDGRAFAEDVSSYEIDGDYLVVVRDGETEQIALDTLFGGGTAGDLEEFDLHDEEDAQLSALAEDLDEDCPVCQANMEAYLNGEWTQEEYEESHGLRAMSRVSTASTPDVSQGQLNIAKRARQMYEVKWTPLEDRYKWRATGVFAAGETVQGLPYGQPVDTGYVGYYSAVATVSDFVDAVNNHDSAFYSGYSNYDGKTAPYYSTDCSAFVSYAWGSSARKTTYSLSDIGTRLGGDTYYSLEVGDALNSVSGGHVVLVSDITYDSEGNIAAIAILEQTPPQVRLTWYGEGYSNSLMTLQNNYFNNGYAIYRCNTRDSVTYTHDCSVPIDGDYCASCRIDAPKVSVSGQANAMQVTLTADSGATIYYTVDGTTPTTGSTVYSGPIAVSQSTKIKAIAVSGSRTSSVLAYNVAVATAEAPKASVSSGEVLRGSTVSLISATDGAAIYYTVDGSTPTASSTLYTGAITINGNMTLKAIAVAANMAYSEVSTFTYTVVDGVTITASAGEGGSIDPSGSVLLYSGGSQTFTITPDTRYEVADVKVDGVSVGAVTTYSFSNVTADRTISATFALKENPFEDVSKDNWYYESVVYVYKAGLFSGETETTFAPNRDITRGEFVTVLGRMADVNADSYVSGSATIAGSEVNFRSGPGTGYSSYGFFANGASVTILSQSGDWYQVSYNGQTGYVHKDYVRVSSGTFSDVTMTKYYAGYIEWATQMGIINGYGNGKFGPDDNLTREQMCVILYNYAEAMGITLPEVVSAYSFTDGDSISAYARTAVGALQRAGIVKGVGDDEFQPKGTSTRAQVANLLMNFDLI